MRTRRLSAWFVAALLAGAPSAVAFAEPTADRESAAAVVTDAERYAAREAEDPSAAEFRGGASVVLIGGSTVTIVLLVVLLVVLL